MTERLACSNCGGAVTRNGSETRVTCPYCQNVTELAPLASARSNNSDDNNRHGSGGGRDVPNIVIIQAPPMIVQGQAARTTERVVQNRPIVIVRRSSPFRFILGPIFFILLFVGISTYIRMRAARMAESIPAAEKAAEKAEKGAEKAPEKKPPGHH